MSKTPQETPAAKRARRSKDEMDQAAKTVAESLGNMTIVGLFAENVKRIKVAQIKPTGKGMVVVSGANGSGKSSVLDAIMWTLRGISTLPSQPIRKGAAKATMTVDLGDIVVTRRMSIEGQHGGFLEINTKKGLRLQSGQTVLDHLMGRISFDPLEFMRMKPAEQLEELRRIAPTAVDIDALDAQIKADYEERRQVKKDADALETRAALIQVPPGTPEAEVDVTGLGRELLEAAQANSLRQERIARINQLKDAEERELAAAVRVDDAAKELRAEAKRLLEQASSREEQASAHRNQAKAAKEERAAIVPGDAVDPAPIQSRLEAATQTNREVRRREERQALVREKAEKDGRELALTESIEARRAERAQAVREAKIPVEGLSFGEGEVTFHDLPFEQASDAERIRISVALAMAANPKIRVLRIKDGSLLDDQNLELIAKMAEANEYQVWVERVDTSGKVGIVMEDGEVVSDGK